MIENASLETTLDAAELGRRVAKACLLDGDLTPEILVAGLENGTYQEFSRNGTVILTKLMNGPLGPGCRIVLAAGDFGDVWALHDEEVVPFARARGRKYMIGNGRPGWKGSAEARGYVEQGWCKSAAGKETLIMIKDLEN